MALRWLAMSLVVVIGAFGVAQTKPTAQIKPQVKPYKVSPSLKEVTNLKQFIIPKEAIAMLAKNLFVVCPANHWQPFFVYEENAYHRIPNFVTVDSMLHLYHLFFNFALRRLEEEKLLPLAEQLTTKLLSQCLQTYRAAPTKELKDAALRNVAYVAVAANLLKLKVSIPKEAQPMVAKELALIQKRAGLVVGAILPYAIDYTQFIPRGHYTRTEKLKRYFMAMMWYGLFPFTPRFYDSKGKLHWSPVTTRQALLLTHDLYAAKLQDTWDKLFTPINFFVGFADDLTPVEVKQLVEQVYGKNPNLSSFADEAKFKVFMEQFTKLRQPQIKPKIAWVGRELPNLPDPETPQLRLLGQRYTPDSEILQELCHPIRRPVPCGLDVMAVLGSERAKQIHDAGYRVHGLPKNFSMTSWDEYQKKRQELIERFHRLQQSEWTRNLYWSWLWVLQSLLQPFGEGYPSFMHTTAWQDKSLQTALASWAQLRHDTILYVKQSLTLAEGGEGVDEKLVKGYVEPNIEAWRRLLHLIRQTRQLLQPRGLLVEDIAQKLIDFEGMVAFLLRCAEKQLQNRPLTRDEYRQLQFIGRDMDFLALDVISDGKARFWHEIVHPADRNMACVADVHTAATPYLGHVALEEAVGHAHEIFVIVPIEGKLVLTRGVVLSYYEFLQPAGKRLTDEQWQEMLRKRKAPPQPAWVRSFTVPTKIRIKEVPVP